MEIKEIQNEREGDYGDAKEAHQAIADSWSVYLSRKFRMKIELEAKDVAILMVLFKSMREAYKHKYDNLLDLASYADFAKRFCEDDLGDTKVFDDMLNKAKEQEYESCKNCNYFMTRIIHSPCRECISYSNFTSNNVADEVPYGESPEEEVICWTCSREYSKCTCGGLIND